MTRKKLIRRRRYITLFEMMIVLTIVASIAGAVGIRVHKAIFEQQFRSEVSLIVDKLRLAQSLMLILDQDVRVKFIERPNQRGIDYWIEFQCPLSKGWQKELERKPKNLTAVRSVNISPSDNRHNEGELELKFLSGGSVMTQGVLRLASAEQSGSGIFERFVCLKGYPHPIFAVADRHANFCSPEINLDNRITQYTVQEVQAKKPAQSSQPTETLPPPS